MNKGSFFTAEKFKTLRDSFYPVLKGGANMIQNYGPSPSIGLQLIETFVKTLIFSIVMQILDTTFTAFWKYNDMSVNLFPLTYDSLQRYKQDPTTAYEIIKPSADERHGIEFSYSCFISVSPETFSGTPGTFRHVYHKGSAQVYPLMAPGVFFKADTNTLRVYMNSQLHWDNYVDIPNFPMKKWVHLVVMVKGNALDVYMNGNLANRFRFTDIPKLNYGDFYLLMMRSFNIKTDEKCTQQIREATTQQLGSGKGDALTAKAINAVGDAAGAVSGFFAGGLEATWNRTSKAVSETASRVGDKSKGGLFGEVMRLSGGSALSNSTSTETQTDVTYLNQPLQISGNMSGYVSKVRYFAYALSYAQIDRLLRDGPSPVIYRQGRQAPVSMLPRITIGWDVRKFFGKQTVPNPDSLDKNLPGYQSDGWWTSDNHSAVSP